MPFWGWLHGTPEEPATFVTGHPRPNPPASSLSIPPTSTAECIGQAFCYLLGAYGVCLAMTGSLSPAICWCLSQPVTARPTPTQPSDACLQASIRRYLEVILPGVRPPSSDPLKLPGTRNDERGPTQSSLSPTFATKSSLCQVRFTFPGRRNTGTSSPFSPRGKSFQPSLECEACITYGFADLALRFQTAESSALRGEPERFGISPPPSL